MLNFLNLHVYQNKYSKIFFSLFIFIVFIILSFTSLIKPTNKSYSLFLEFDHAYGLKKGTPVTYKGVNIGVVSRIGLSMNKIVVLVNIKSSNILIPSNSVFEANQSGLFNDIVISINLCNKSYDLQSEITNLAQSCNKCSSFIQHNSYIKGYKGLSYDDLIRSTTRISQRFDDPRFFSLFYLLLKNGLYLSDELLVLTYNFSSIYQVFAKQLLFSLSKQIL